MVRTVVWRNTLCPGVVTSGVQNLHIEGKRIVWHNLHLRSPD